MLILLPPSEGKTSPQDGPYLNLEELSFPELTGARSLVIHALQRLGTGPEATATLGLGKKSENEVLLNLELLNSPCTEAINLYTGVLYDHLDARTLDAESRGRLRQQALISSALFGLLRPDDLIPNHRLSIGVRLPGIGTLGPWWREQIKRASSNTLGIGNETVFDARSGGYRSAFSVGGSDVVELSVAEERAGGRKVITHMAKKWRGLATRHLIKDKNLEAGASREQVLDSLVRLAQESHSLGVLDLEIAATKQLKNGDSRTVATLVTASTEKN